MTSLDFRLRKMRRNAVLYKIEFIDIATKDGDKDFIPTAVDFVISGRSRCRIVGSSMAMKARIERWRRCYDENGEEVLLGWGEERFLDLPEGTISPLGENFEYELSEQNTDHRSWCSVDVKCNLDKEEVVDDQMVTKARSLLPLVDEWYELASNSETYSNTNVTATARIERGKPYMSIDPKKFMDA